jgi:hypothetical protein
VAAFRETWLQDAVINDSDAPMPVAYVGVNFNAASSGFMKVADKATVYGDNPYYRIHIPAEPWISKATADGQGYNWDSWNGAEGPYDLWEWATGSDDDSTVLLYTDNHGEAMVYVNGDRALKYTGCDDNTAAAGIVTLATGQHWCELNDVVGTTTLWAWADYPDKRKHTPVKSGDVTVTWTWGGYKTVDIHAGETDQFKYVVVHVKDRDGYCSPSPSANPVIGEAVEFVLDSIGDGRIVGVSPGGTIGTLGQDAAAVLVDSTTATGAFALHNGTTAKLGDECQAWVKISNSLLGVTDVLVYTHNPEGAAVFDRVVDFTSTTTYTLHFRWSLITWPGENAIAVGTAITGLTGVTAIYGWDGVTQSWAAYFPDGVGVPGANDLVSLTNGQAYWIAIAGPNSVAWTIVTNVS